jgi:hypothetical protein
MKAIDSLKIPAIQTLKYYNVKGLAYKPPTSYDERPALGLDVPLTNNLTWRGSIDEAHAIIM